MLNNRFSLAINRLKQQSNSRNGLTLVELMIVMAIIVLLASLTLPSVKNLLKDQRISQAARIVQGFAEAAKSKSIASGRRVALVLERARSDAAGGLGSDALIANDTCIRLSLAEVFPPYEGDWSGSTARVFDTSGDGFVDSIEIPVSQAASLTGANPLVSAGDLVELADRNQGFIVTAAPTVQMSSGGLGINVVQISLANPPMNNGRQSHEPIWPLTPELAAGAEVTFRIYRKPSKMLAGSVVLPRGTCIDLSISGVGPSGRDFSTRAITPGAVTTPTAGDFGPIYVVFSPRGSVEIAYYQGRTMSGVNQISNIQRVFPRGIFHFLVGRNDQVDPGYLTPNAMNAVSGRDEFRPNALDPANVWVSINPYSGAIYSSKLNVGSGDIASARLLASSGATRQGN